VGEGSTLLPHGRVTSTKIAKPALASKDGFIAVAHPDMRPIRQYRSGRYWPGGPDHHPESKLIQGIHCQPELAEETT
jgi:hypothetical protein